jgi:hypothetical protein
VMKRLRYMSAKLGSLPRRKRRRYGNGSSLGPPGVDKVHKMVHIFRGKGAKGPRGKGTEKYLPLIPRPLCSSAPFSRRYEVARYF